MIFDLTIKIFFKQWNRFMSYRIVNPRTGSITDDHPCDKPQNVSCRGLCYIFQITGKSVNDGKEKLYGEIHLSLRKESHKWYFSKLICGTPNEQFQQWHKAALWGSLTVMKGAFIDRWHYAAAVVLSILMVNTVCVQAISAQGKVISGWTMPQLVIGFKGMKQVGSLY